MSAHGGSISVVVATWRRPDVLRGCLAALDAQTVPAAEIVVVVRDEDDATRAALAALPPGRSPLRVLSVAAPGVVVALNAALEVAVGDVVAFTDDDAAPRPDWLARIDEHFRRHPDVGGVGGRDWLHPPDPGSGDGSVVGRVLPYGRVVANHHLGTGGARDVDVLKGVNVALRRSALGAIRLDERLRGEHAQMHWELALCLAVKDAGWRLVYDPAVATVHYPAARAVGDQRHRPTGRSLADEVHNETYALLRWLPRRRRRVAFAYGVLVGSRRAPGLVTAVERLVREPDGGAVAARALTAQRARVAALKTAREARRAPREPGEHPTVTIVAHDVATSGGMERQLGELCSGLLDRGHRVVVVARRCELPEHPRLRWVRVPLPEMPFSLLYPCFFVAGSWAVRRHREGLVHTTGALVGNRADVSTLHFFHHGFRAAVGKPQTTRLTFAYRVNAGASAWMSRAAERFCLRSGRTRRLVAVSEGLACEVRRELPHARLVVIPNGVDRARFSPDTAARAAVRAELRVEEEALVALFVGGDWDRKGLRLAIEAVAGTDGWRLLVVGRDDEQPYRDLAASCGAEELVRFVGGTQEPARYYAAADAFVLPSAYEAFPLVALEAAAAGLPLIGSRVSGLEELIDDGRNGWHVKREAAPIAERLRELGADPTLRRTMGQAARADSAEYTWDRVVDAYVKLYAELAGTAPPAEPSPTLSP